MDRARGDPLEECSESVICINESFTALQEIDTVKQA